MKSFAVLILAAGFSRRMGQFKPLLKINGETIIDHLISTFLINKVEVYIVVGYRGWELMSALKHREVIFVENPNYAHGMFTSVQAGVRSLKSGHKAFFVMPVDIPLVKISTIKLLRNTYKEHLYKIIYPVFNNKRGHPPLIPISLAPIIAERERDGNLRAVLNAYEKVALEVTVNDENILLDMNTDKDYQTLLKRFHTNKS
jgi:molybdenum cofactor cytidylyltransferase